MKFVLASHNQGKLAEMQRILGQLGVEVVLQSELGLALEPEDDVTLRQLKERGDANGVPGLALLSGEEVRRREPNLSPAVRGALYAPTAGIITPWSLAIGLADTARIKNFVEWHFFWDPERQAKRIGLEYPPKK